MSGGGGLATFLGVRYEVQVVLGLMPELLEGTLVNVRYQPPSSAFSPGDLALPIHTDDFSSKGADGSTLFGQAKHNSRDGQWTFARLIREGVIHQFWNQNLVSPSSTLEFVSNLDAPTLKSVAAAAARTVGPAEFAQELTTSEQEAVNLAKLGLGTADSLWALLRQVRVRRMGPEDAYRALALYATDRYADLDKFILCLKEFIESSPGVSLTTDLAVQYLKGKGLHRFPASLPVDVKPLLVQLSAPLRNYHSEILGVHLERSEVDHIVSWVRSTTDDATLALLLDDAGTGKSVAMRDLLTKLEGSGVPVLAIKADFLVEASGGLLPGLDPALNVSPEGLLSKATKDGLVVLLVDQVDALSMTFARNQEMLNRVLTLIAVASAIPKVRVIASCRTFDRKFDPKLRSVRASREFTLKPLGEAEIRAISDRIGTPWEELSQREKELLRIPLHLKLWGDVVQERKSRGLPKRGVESLQDLYEAIWEIKVLTPRNSSIPSDSVIKTIHRLSEEISRTAHLFQPLSLVDQTPEARQYLESEGILRREGSSLGFFHQSFFDFTFARRFVAESRSLREWVVSREQGLFVRPQLLQILGYLRGSKLPEYLPTIRSLLDLAWSGETWRMLRLKGGFPRLALAWLLRKLLGVPIRYHLQRLTLEWIAQLNNYSVDEKQLLRSLLEGPATAPRLLDAARGNGEAFAVLSDRLPGLVQSLGPQKRFLVGTFLQSVTPTHAKAVFDLINSQLDQSAEWVGIAQLCLNYNKVWVEKAQLCLLRVCEKMPDAWHGLHLAMLGIGPEAPLTACHALKILLNHQAAAWVEAQKKNTEGEENQSSSLNGASSQDMEEAFKRMIRKTKVASMLLPREGFWLDDVIEPAVKAIPKELVEVLLPWLLSVLPALTDEGVGLRSDDLFERRYRDEHDTPAGELISGLEAGLRSLAKDNRPVFLNWADSISNCPFLVLHQVLLAILEEETEQYSAWIFAYLTSKREHLHVGNSPGGNQYSRQAISRVFPHLTTADRQSLEQIILTHFTEWEMKAENLNWRGFTQLELLHGIDDALLSPAGRTRKHELQRKFPGQEPRPGPLMKAGTVRSPITREKLSIMSDDALLAALRAYNDPTKLTTGRDFLKGGTRELSYVLEDLATKDPARLARVTLIFDAEIVPQYYWASLSGLAKSSIDTPTLFKVCEHCWETKGSDSLVQGTLCDTLASKSDQELPEVLKAALHRIALSGDVPSELPMLSLNGRERDVFEAGINSPRGKAVRAFCAFYHNSKAIPRQEVYETFERIASDSSPGVRACLVEGLTPMLANDAERAITLFEKAVHVGDPLLNSMVVRQFLYHSLYKSFGRVAGFVEALVRSQGSGSAEQGAQLTTLAYFTHDQAGRSYKRCLKGRSELRGGVAQILAANVGIPEIREKCTRGLLELLNDPQESVRTHLGAMWRNLPAPNADDTRKLVNKACRSPHIGDFAEDMIEYAQRISIDHPDLAVNIAGAVADELQRFVSEKGVISHWDDQVVGVCIGVLSRSVDRRIRGAAIDVFEKVLSAESPGAKLALAQTDR